MVEEMGFGEIFTMNRMRADSALTQALRSRWDAEATAFIFPWGHMIPSLEDVSRITGLRIYRRPVSGYTYPCYHGLAQRLLELPVEHRSSLVRRVPLQESLGLFYVGKGAGESEDEHLDRLVRVSQKELASELGAQADLNFRRFLVLFLSRLLFTTRGDAVHYRFLPLLEDLSEVGGYAWGAAFLAHQFDSLGASERQTSTNSRNLGDQLERLQEAIDSYPYLDPYLGEGDEGQPWLVQARPYFGRVPWSSPFEIGFADQVDVAGEVASLRALLYSAVQDREAAQRQTAELGAGESEEHRSRRCFLFTSCRGVSIASRGPAGRSGAEGRGGSEASGGERDLRLTTEHAIDLQGQRDQLQGEVQTTRSERDQLRIRTEAAEAQVAEATKELEALRVQRSPVDREELDRVRAELRAQEAM
ncbi:hypothetical protein Taro_036954 [Colocasia esculenta]|uniref:Aminotransferase-like plant mobile domain-containing protein n=1 Tax=Colocasia esculenta TaxID=4460 RepID=A0A843W8A2_COLES|nr:hypothetical protein [Colocasia esculenta]